ncbi:MAG: gliding motility-associated C-terminal domain-containing protein, partial [Bacteroidota bacterium]
YIMKERIVLLLLLCSLLFFPILDIKQALGQSVVAPPIEWTKTYGGSGEDHPYFIQQTSDGGYIIAGRNSSYITGTGGNCIYLIRTDSIGNIAWTKSFGGSDSGSNFAYSVQQTTDGGFIMVGRTESYGAGITSFYVIKTDGSGNISWTKVLGGTSGDEAASVQQTSDGGYIIGGASWSFSGGDWDCYLIKITSAGNISWSKTYGGTGTDCIYSVQQTTDLGYIMTGWTTSFGAGSYDVYLIKTDANGDTLWTRTFGDAGEDKGNTVKQTTDGGYIISTGFEAGPFSSGSDDLYLIKTDSNGNAPCMQSNTATVVGTPATATVSGVLINSGGVVNTPATITGAPATIENELCASCDLTANITDSSNITCSGATDGWAVVSTGGGTAPYTYSWTPSGSANDTATGLTVGTHTIIVTDINGCTAQDSVVISEPSVLTTNIPDSSNITCNGADDGWAVVTAGGGTAPYTYSWTPSGSTNDTATGLSPGTHTIIVTDANGCTAQDSVNITQPAALVLSIIDTADATCGLNNGTATAITSGGMPPYTYSWNDPLSQTDTIADSLSAGIYTVTVSDSLNCIDSVSININEIGGPTATITQATNITCYSDSSGLTTVTPSGGTLPYTYAWDDPGSQTDSTATGLPAGTYITTVTDNNGCSGFASVTITQPTALIADAGIDDTLCPGGSIVIGGSPTASGSTPPYTYIWTPTVALDDSTSANPTASPIVNINYIVTITDSNNCTANDTLEIIINLTYNTPVLDTICDNDSVFLEGAWQNTQGIYYDTLTATNWCDSVIATTLTVNPVFNTPVSQTICDNDSVFLDGAWQNIAGTYYDITTAANGCDSIITTNLTILPTLSTTIDTSICQGDSLWAGGAYQTIPGTYYDTLLSVYGCDSVIVTTLSVYPPPTAVITGITAICIGDNTTLTASGGNTYLWNTGDTTPSITISPLITTTYTVIASNTGCDLTEADSVMVIVNPLSIISIAEDTITIIQGESVTLNVSGGISYYWYSPEGLSNPASSNPVSTPAGTTVYYVSGTDANGCTNTDSVLIVVIDDVGIDIPDIFSPNNDGENDVYYIYGKGIKNIKFIVFDRWGEKVYEAKEVTNGLNGKIIPGWDGSFRGKPMDPAVFVYYLEANDGEIIRQGNITLIR